MHLKSLTLKGFKSFASATHLKFEPGINCVVGPNGSGKSNVVDALAWVMGEQGAKSLRGGKMEDVIFAGTAGRAPLGRAEVTLTIDNADGALPIEYVEVSITRRMFRSGESEYEINGNKCRLLDVQELLSDSGIGREMHVIIGQGKLDSVLQAKPEDRRGFIEEAAGVLKHRKRKEKAVRKLEAMSANLTRLTDLTAELRRQLKPLGKQAEVARRAATVQADLRDARLRLLADDFISLRTTLEKEVADEAAIRERRTYVESELGEARQREGELDKVVADLAPALARAQETWYKLSSLAERFRGTAQLADERVRFLSSEPEETRSGRDPEQLEREAAAVREEEAELTALQETESERLEDAIEARREFESRLQQAEKALVAAVRSVADRREGLAKLTGQVNAARSRTSAKADEIERLSATIAQAVDRAQQAQSEFDTLQAQIEGLNEGELGLDERHEAASEEYQTAKARVDELKDALRAAEKSASEWKAREEALALGLRRKDGAAALLAAGERAPGLLGSVAALLTVEPGAEAALAAALGPIADAVAAATADDAITALKLLREEDAGQAGILIGSSGPPVDRNSWPPLPAGARWAVDAIRAPEHLQRALVRALDRVALVPDLAAARSLVAYHPAVRAVTAEGDQLGVDWAAGGSASAPSLIEVQAAVDEAEHHRKEYEEQASRLAAELEAATAASAAAKEQVETTLQALHESDARLNAVTEQLAQLGAAARSATGEAERLTAARRKAEEARDQDLEALNALEERLFAAEDTPVDDEPSTDERDELSAEVVLARQREMDARLAVRTAEERVRALHGRADSLERAAAAERAARERAERARAARIRGAQIAKAVSVAARKAAEKVAMSLEIASAERDAANDRRAAVDGELVNLRARTRELASELDKLTDAVHKDEMARAEQRMRIDALETKAAEDHGIEIETLLEEYGPEQLVPPSAAELAKAEADGKEPPEPKPYDRAVQEKRAAKAERDLQLLGKVNPLALEEFAALEERHTFLSTQLEDLKKTRKDLQTVIKDVDERILEVFTEAYNDVAAEFEVVFRTLFPGGEGRLILTDPDDMLLTGIEVEARPPGKKVKRLSLLSGGERSLTAVALLVAIFRARPSPFYVLDEVEAALDDTNLGRLLTLIEQLRDTSQLLIITHQKRTMEIADALYGVSMRGDGITQVISQRIREPEPVS
ncbi:chromosome segregation protein SMC [Fodinicola acaciae]|uniref:chromosome segregation protein SMC n=1 Tax=Fodinicola acaciae TaxID=2681555 RepID=UPI0013D3770A|nr:chromosome segregation protein SMC [Fodinicola acaciae]